MIIARPSLLVGDRAKLGDSRPSEAFAVAVWRALAPWLPGVLTRQLGTPVEAVAARLVAEVLENAPGRRVIEAGELG